LQWLTAKNLRTAADTEGRLEKHFLPKFGDRLVSGLTKSDLDGWLASLMLGNDWTPQAPRARASGSSGLLPTSCRTIGLGLCELTFLNGRISSRAAPDHLRRLAVGAEKGTPHSVAIPESGQLRNNVNLALEHPARPQTQSIIMAFAMAKRRAGAYDQQVAQVTVGPSW
jgi:hypothetical protein